MLQKCILCKLKYIQLRSEACFPLYSVNLTVMLKRIGGFKKNVLFSNILIPKILITIRGTVFMLTILFIVCKQIINMSYLYTLSAYFRIWKNTLLLVYTSCTLLRKSNYKKYTYLSSKCLLCCSSWCGKYFCSFPDIYPGSAAILANQDKTPLAVLSFDSSLNYCSFPHV